jgi:hypothetical protein
VITPLLWTNLEPRQPDLPTYQYGEGPSADYEPGGARCEPAVLAAIRDNRKAAAERERCSDAAEEHRLKSDDLVQQTRAANAADQSARTNYDLARMALWGTIGGFLTLIAASLAAYYARDAAKASRETVTAFVAVERPRLVPGLDGCWYDEEKTYLALKAENVGKTSAYVDRLYYNVLEGPIPNRPFRLVDQVARDKSPAPAAILTDIKHFQSPL